MTSRVLQSLIEESFFLADGTAPFLGFFGLARLFGLAGFFGFCEGNISGCPGVWLRLFSVAGSGSRSERIGQCFFSWCRSSGGLRLVIIILR